MSGRRRRTPFLIMLFAAALFMLTVMSVWLALLDAMERPAAVRQPERRAETPLPEPEPTAKQGDFLESYPEALQELYRKNEEARDFVLAYYEKKGKEYSVDLSELRGADTVPLLMQWDERWGYRYYAGNLMGLSGCGPTVMSMAAIYLTGNTSLDPGTVAAYSEENGHAIKGNGTAWTLFSKGAAGLGLESQELPLDKGRIDSALRGGALVVLILGPGDFTDTGHYILITGIADDGGYTVNDPNSRANSEKTWSYDTISEQIKNIWALNPKN